MPPHSFAEWVIGQNLPKRIRKPNPPSGNEKQQYKLELFTDDELQVEKVALTYPRAAWIERDEPADPDNSATKKVSFSSPPKPAIKKSAVTSPTEMPKEAPSASDKEGETSNAMEFNDSSDGHGRGRRRRRSRRHSSRRRWSRSTSSGRDTDDSESCRCPKCKAKQIKLSLRYRERRLNRKLRELRQIEHRNSSDESDTSDSEPPQPRCHQRIPRRKNKASPVTDSSEDGPQTEESESETSYESYVSTDTDSLPRRRSSRRAHRHYSRKHHKSRVPASKDEEAKEKTEAKEAETKNVEANNTDSKDVGPKYSNLEASKPQVNKAQTVQPLAFRPERTPCQDIVRPNLLLPVRAQVLKVEHAVEEPEDPRPNSFYDIDSGTVRVYHGPVYGNPTGTMYPIRNRNRVASLPVGVPHPLSNPYNEASPFGLPSSFAPPMPYWPGQPVAPLPGLSGYPPLPYYNPMGLETSPRTISSEYNRRTEANTDHEYQRRKPERGRRSPPKVMEQSKLDSGNNYYSSPPNRHQARQRSSQRQETRERDGNDGLDSNSNAASIFNHDDNSGEGWGRSAWDNPPSLDKNQDGGRRNQSSAEPWSNDTGANQADNDGNTNWGNTDQKNERWGAGSADNNNKKVEDDYWANIGAEETTSQKNWHNDSSSGQKRDRPNSADNNDSWKMSSSGFTALPSDTNVIPPMAYKQKKREKHRNSGDAGNWGWVVPPNPSQGMSPLRLARNKSKQQKNPRGKLPACKMKVRVGYFKPAKNTIEYRSMPGAWEEPVSNTQETAYDNRERHSRSKRGKAKATKDRDDFVPSWGDPTAAQSSHDPPAFRGDKDNIGGGTTEMEQW